MSIPDPLEITLTFNDYITASDLHGIESIITDDHTFIDMQGNEVHGKKTNLEAWSRFFELFPDYENVFEETYVHEMIVTLRGYSSCSHPRMNTRGIWTAHVIDDKVSEWRIYEDSEENRKLLGIDL